MYIYIIQNNLNGKCYVGQTTNWRQRRNKHWCELRKGQHLNKHLQAAFNRDGEESFIFHVVREVPNEQATTYEQFYINLLQTTLPEFGYNKRIAADSNLGMKRGPQTLEHITKRTMTMLETKKQRGVTHKGSLNPNYRRQQSIEERKRRMRTRFPGTKFDKRRNKWIARPCLNNKEHYLGQYDSRIEAFQACLTFLEGRNLTISPD